MSTHAAARSHDSGDSDCSSPQQSSSESRSVASVVSSASRGSANAHSGPQPAQHIRTAADQSRLIAQLQLEFSINPDPAAALQPVITASDDVSSSDVPPLALERSRMSMHDDSTARIDSPLFRDAAPPGDANDDAESPRRAPPSAHSPPESLSSTERTPTSGSVLPMPAGILGEISPVASLTPSGFGVEIDSLAQPQDSLEVVLQSDAGNSNQVSPLKESVEQVNFVAHAPASAVVAHAPASAVVAPAPARLL